MAVSQPVTGSTGVTGRATLERRRAAHVRAATQLALDSALAELIVAFEACGVRPLLLKGPAFAQWLYDDPRQRPYGDIDLLVAPEQLAEAGDVLAERGFSKPPWGSRPRELSHHIVWARGDTVRVCVELHHTLDLVPASPSLVWRRLAANAQTIEVAGATAEVPALPAAALIVAVHGAKHGAGDAKHVRDVRHALARVDIETWRDAAALALELGAGEAFAAGLRLDPAGGELAEQLGLGDHTRSRLLRLYADSAPHSAIGIEYLVSTRGASARLRLVLSTLAPSRGRMLANYPFTSRGRVWLAVAYVWRPLRIVAKLPRGLWLWLAVPRKCTPRR